VQIHKAEIIATLRSRGMQARADWVDRELPSIIDTYENEALLKMLDIDPATMEPAEVDADDRKN
jgi:hypothetical protein